MNTKNEITIFENEEFGQVRVMGTPENPWFVAKDVATALGYTNPQKAIRDHVENTDKQEITTWVETQYKGELTERNVQSGQNRKVIVINESGVYALIFGSKLERAKKFKRWVTSEVLPAIRKQGYYGDRNADYDHAIIDLVRNVSEGIAEMTKTLNKVGKYIEVVTESQTQTERLVKVATEAVQIAMSQPKPSTNQAFNQPKTKYTGTDICRMFGFHNARDLNNELVSRGVLSRDGLNVSLTPTYVDRDIANVRPFIRNGKQVSTFIVWNDNGLEFLKTLFGA
jgi:prophage antirepressor-like protein